SLAARLKVERSTVVRWEAGKSQPQAWLWPKLAAALKVTPEQLADLLAKSSLGAVTHSPPQPLTAAAHPSGNLTFDSSISSSPDGGMFNLRRVLMGGIPDTPPGTPIELTTAVARTWNLFFPPGSAKWKVCFLPS
ncbi:helix-turn-helix transcriptional regulator, partial [Nocardia sp. alder85J]